MMKTIAQESPVSYNGAHSEIGIRDDKCIPPAGSNRSIQSRDAVTSCLTALDGSTPMDYVEKADDAKVVLEEAANENSPVDGEDGSSHLDKGGADRSSFDESSTVDETCSFSSANIHEVPSYDDISVEDCEIVDTIKETSFHNIETLEPVPIVVEEETKVGVVPDAESDPPSLVCNGCTDPKTCDVPALSETNNSFSMNRSEEQPAIVDDTAPIDVSNGKLQPLEKAELGVAATAIQVDSQKTDISRSTAQSDAPNGLRAVNIHLPTTNQVTFEPFDALKFTKLKRISFMEKVKNFHDIVKRICKLVNSILPISTYISVYMYLILFILIIWKMSGGTVGGLFEKLVIIAFVILAVKVMDFFLNVWYAVSLEPLKILVEASDIMGESKQYLITDTRSRIARAWNWRTGDRMDFVYAKNPSVPLWRTRATGFWTPSRITLDRAIDDATFASYEIFKCCGEAQEDQFAWWKVICNVRLVTTIKTPQTGGFVSISQPICGERNQGGNLIERSESVHANQLAVRKNAFSCKDLFCDFFDVGIEDIVGEEAALAYDTANEAIGIKDDVKDAFELLKEGGYQKVQNPDDVWDVKFRPGMNEEQKAAVVLYVIKQYVLPVQ